MFQAYEDYSRRWVIFCVSARSVLTHSDVLTISKLDSGLFAMTPVDVQLESTARDAVKMFTGEAKSAGIDLQFQIDHSCKRFDIVNVSLDPTRVSQILINLLTNAIKFTRLEKKRQIVVNFSISLERPTHNADGRVMFIPRTGGTEAKTLLADWDQGDSVRLSCGIAYEHKTNRLGLRAVFGTRYWYRYDRGGLVCC